MPLNSFLVWYQGRIISVGSPILENNPIIEFNAARYNFVQELQIAAVFLTRYSR